MVGKSHKSSKKEEFPTPAPGVVRRRLGTRPVKIGGVTLRPGDRTNLISPEEAARRPDFEVVAPEETPVAAAPATEEETDGLQ